MKDSDLQELKPAYIQIANYSADDEISLIDLAIVLVRRWKMIATIIILVITLIAIYNLKQPRYFTYSTSLEVGSRIINETIQPFPTTQSLLAKVEYGFIPQMQHERKSSNLHDEIKYKIKPIIPEGSNIIVLEIKGAEGQSVLLLNALEDLSQRIIQDNKRSYDSVKQNITTSREALKAELALLNTQGDMQTDRKILITNKIDNYNSQLENLQSTRVIAPPMKSLEPTGRSNKLIIIVTVFAGIFLAVFAAFFAEFILKVKEKL